MTLAAGRPLAVLLTILLSLSTVLPAAAQTGAGRQEDPGVGAFMRHLRANWDDIHDVIMRFHHDDPGLKGVVFINTNWRQGTLVAAAVDSNSTGNEAFGPALIEAMQRWLIQDLPAGFALTVPFRTAIHGSDDPAFPGRAIFTGRVTDRQGNPIDGARLILTPGESLDAAPDTNYTNREGIFIQTLIPPGDWRLACSRDGFAPTLLDPLTFGKGRHMKMQIRLLDDERPAAGDGAKR